MSGQHSIAPPSAAGIWGFCAAAIPAIASADDKDTYQSREGTAAHWVGSEVLGTVREHWAYTPAANWIGQVAPNGVKIDEVMAEGAQVYVDDFLARMSEIPGAQTFVEYRVVANRVHPKNWGTLDGSLVDFANRHIVLWDYKHGFGRVPAKENLQAIDYLVGLLEAIHGGKPYDDRQWSFEVRIVQPRCFAVRGRADVWAGNCAELRGYVNQLSAKVHEGLGPNPCATPGAHCRYCPGLLTCAAADQFCGHIVDMSTGTSDLSAISGPELTILRDVLTDGQTLVKQRLEAVEDELLHRLSKGDTTTGLALQAVRSNRGAWNIPDTQVIAMGKQLGADLRKNVALTPKQASKAIPDDKVEVWEKISGGLYHHKTVNKLINADETLAAKTFGAIKNANN